MIYKIILPGLVFLISACVDLKPEHTLTQDAITDHVLINKVWSVKKQQFVDPKILKQDALTANVLLLGETHDNAMHHQLQSEMIAHLISHNHQPAVAFEMLDRDQQEAIDLFLQKYTAAENVDTFAEAIDWKKSGWPDWSLYRPVFNTVLKAELALIAANLNHKLIREVIQQGPEVLPVSYQQLLTKYQYDDNTRQELETEIFSAHCEMLAEKHLPPMLMAQQLRDISMSQILVNRQAVDGIVLIAGSGHIRNDYGVPFYLQTRAAESQTQKQDNSAPKIISLAFIEVSDGADQVKDYAEKWNRQYLPFDYVWFTVKASREDQCERFKKHMQNKQASDKKLN